LTHVSVSASTTVDKGAKSSRDGYGHIGTRVKSGGREVEVACSYGYRDVSREECGRADETVMYDCVYTASGDARPALNYTSERCPELELPDTTFAHLAAVPPALSHIAKRSLGTSLHISSLTSVIHLPLSARRVQLDTPHIDHRRAPRNHFPRLEDVQLPVHYSWGGVCLEGMPLPRRPRA
jgi:hypothetical protein